MNLRKKAAALSVSVLIPSLLIFSIIFAAVQPKVEPSNPLLNTAPEFETTQQNEEEPQENDLPENNEQTVQEEPVLQKTEENSEQTQQNTEKEPVQENAESAPQTPPQKPELSEPSGNVPEITPEPDNEDIVYFTTDITDGAVLNERSFSFTVTHLQKNLTVKSESVYVNGKLQPFFGKALLDEGSNVLKIIVLYTDNSGKVITSFRDFTLFTDLGNFEVFTNLENKTVNEAFITFFAYTQGKAENAKLTVVCNGKTLIAAENNTYTAPLNIGLNSLRLKATCTKNGEKLTVNKTFTVTYEPLANLQTAPKIEYINVTDNMAIKGSSFTLDLLAKDHLQNRIYHDTIFVTLNGKVYSYTWATEFTSYLLYFENGKNILKIRITDSDGRYADYSYTIYCTSAENGEKLGTFTLSIDAKVLNLGYILNPVKIDFYQGKTISQTITDFLNKNGFTYKYGGTISDGFYLARLEKEGIAKGASVPEQLREQIEKDNISWSDQHYDNSLGELDFCKGSGWHWALNGHFAGYSMSDAVVQDGDKIEIRFSLAYGKDIGAYNTGGGNNYDKVW